MRRALRAVWQIICALVFAAIGAALPGGIFESWPLAGVGAVLGLPIGWIFGRFISLFDILDQAG